MKTKKLLFAATTAALLLGSSGTIAEDIDLYMGNTSPAVAPNVMLIIDTAANFGSDTKATCLYKVDPDKAYTTQVPSMTGTVAGIEQCALYNAILSLPIGAAGEARVHFGIMFYNKASMSQYGCTAVSSIGGCVVKQLTPMNAAGKRQFLDFIRSWDLSQIKSNGQATGQVMQEAWAYYTGKIGVSGRDYASIKPASGCQRNFVIFLGNAVDNNGTPGDGGLGSKSLAQMLTAAGGNATARTPLPYAQGATCNTKKPFYATPAHSESSGLYADEWARFMYRTDIHGDHEGSQNILTYTIGALGANCRPDYPALLTSMAKEGGGQYFETNADKADEIENALNMLVNEVQAVNSVFSSSSLPVNANAQGTYRNQIFMGMFRPDPAGEPRWLGNLKQYQFIYDKTSKTLTLGDKNGDPALNSAGTGFISLNADSFWTKRDDSVQPDLGGGFWRNQPSGSDALKGLTPNPYDAPDGEIVEKGGAAQQARLRSLFVNYTASPGGPRKLFTYCPTGSTCISDLTTAANAFSTANADLLAVTGLNTSLINWVRGEDNKGDELGPDATKTSVNIRPSLHGDVLHSRPLVIDYGGTTGVVVFYGANDGVFRAVNGNQTASIGSVPAGGELWGFVAPEFYGKLNRQRENSPLLKLPNTPQGITPPPEEKDYFVDGSTGVFQKIDATGNTTKAQIFMGMRRGGRFIYAMDVTNPAAPKVMWRKSSSDAGFGELGQTWSQPRPAVIKGFADPVLIFGAGYDPADDAEPPAAASRAMGRGIFLVDAATGDLIWSAKPQTSGSTSCSGTGTSGTCLVAGMNYAIPGDITLLDRDGDKKIDRLYAADTGGNVWRVDLESSTGATPDQFRVNKLAAVGCNTGACADGTTPRKFFYAPDVIPFGPTDGAGSFDLVMLASGDREHPLSTDAANVENRFYAIKDFKTGKEAGTLTPVTEASTSLFDATSVPYDNSVNGYYFSFAGPGEKGVNAATTIAGTTYFGTNQVKSQTSACGPALGIATGYQINPLTGTRTSVQFDGGGLPPSPVAGLVSITGADGKTELVPFIIGGGQADCATADCKSAMGVGRPPIAPSQKRKRTYWYGEKR